MHLCLPLLASLVVTLSISAAESPASIAAGEKKLAEIALGGDFKPDPEVPAFVVVGHGGRIIVSKDDGKTWTQAFFGHPGADHGPSATKWVACGGGVFVVAVGWGAFKDDGRGHKLSTHHMDPEYCGDASGRFLALGGNRGDAGPKFGDLFATDDLGKTWRWLNPEGLDASTGRGTLVSNGKLLVMTDKEAESAWTSADAGETWSGPHATGTKRATLSVVGSEFWLAGKPSRASADGKTWRDLPAAVPAGQIIASNKGTLISIQPQRFNILRSADGGKTWTEVHTYKPADIQGGAQGLRDGAVGFLKP
jgi:photosystem II stability/assembly factor-like uncharacterized protein